MYRFINHSRVPDYDWDLNLGDRLKQVEILIPVLFFARGEVITLNKLKEYFTDKAITKFEGDKYIKLL